MVSKKIHCLEEVRQIPTVVGQRKQGALAKWESAKDRDMEPQTLSFLIKAVYEA